MCRRKSPKETLILKDKFWAQWSQAKQRGIEFLLTFEEWLQIWIDSGHLHERGPYKGQYVMARFGDVGPYAVGNVKIITNSENTVEAHKGSIRSDSTRSLLRERASGKIRSEEAKQKTSATLKANVEHTRIATEIILAQTKKNVGSKRSAETCAKISAAARRRYTKNREDLTL